MDAPSVAIHRDDHRKTRDPNDPKGLGHTKLILLMDRHHLFDRVGDKRGRTTHGVEVDGTVLLTRPQRTRPHTAFADHSTHAKMGDDVRLVGLLADGSGWAGGDELPLSVVPLANDRPAVIDHTLVENRLEHFVQRPLALGHRNGGGGNVRSQRNVPPRDEVPVAVSCRDEGTAGAVSPHVHVVEDLARARPVTVGVGLDRPEGAATAVLDRAQVYVPIAVDVEAERERLTKQLKKEQKYLQKIEGKLHNQQYLERAPKEVVDRDRKTRAEVLERIEKLNGNLETL